MSVCSLRSRSKSLSLNHPFSFFLYYFPYFHPLRSLLSFSLPTSIAIVGWFHRIRVRLPYIQLRYILSHLRRVHPLAPQVSVAVLLDNFITASTRMELEEKEQETVKFLRERQANNPLEPLLIKVIAQSPAGGARGQSIDVLHDLPNFKLLT